MNKQFMQASTQTSDSIQKIVQHYEQGHVFAYPTEAVYGLGCDPQNKNAVYKILALKTREVEKGVILIASDFAQIADYVRFDSLTKDTQHKILATWPGPVTWLLPKSAHTPEWISGNSDMVAVRITEHPIVIAMCEAINGPLVSTSANPAGKSPAKTVAQLHAYFQDAIDDEALHIIEGALGAQNTPSKIFHSLSMDVVRA